MVFESVVVDVLNRFLGSYVENLDASQLKIGIFGGDVDLKDLIIKPSALDDLNVPFRVTYGFIKKLTLKIPWKDIYGAPVVATVDGLYAVVVPSSGTKYDQVKEFRAIQDAKQRALATNEEMKLKAREMRNPSKKEKEDTLVEKIVAQVVKNVQVKISNIHVRYEDNFSNAARPFCCGVTLNRLHFETTDQNWRPQMVDRSQHVFNKLVTLDSFSFYWNSRVRLISHLSPREIMSELVDTIAREQYKPPGIGYMLGPITSTARLTINQKPELSDYQTSQTVVDILVEDISIALAKCQYHDLMALADSVNRMWLADKFRKYHPEVPLHNNAKKWWKFANTAILEEQVRPKRQQWNIDYLLGHIRKVKEYREEYKNKLQSKKETDRLKKLEEELDLFNIILARRQAEVEVEKLPKIEPKRGWFGGWWGGSAKPEGAGNEIVSSLQKEMTSEEKAKLYAAIDYNENQVPLEYPAYYVDKKLNFLLRTLNVIVSDDSRGSREIVMQTTLKEVSSSIEMRPKGDGLRVGAKIEAFKIESFPGDGVKRRTLLTSDNKASQPLAKKHLLDVTFDKNPLEGGCDQRIRVFAEPVEMFYDVRSFDAVVDIFKPPDTVSIDNIQNTAASGLKNLRVMSATGLQHAIDNKPSLDVLVEVKPSYVLIYEGGRIDDTKNVLVLSMGQLAIKSKPRNKDAPTVRDMVQAGSSEKEVLAALFNEAYDKMEFYLSAAELLVVPSCELWRECVKASKGGTHVLEPTDLYINVDICFLPDEKRIPKVKISGKLPALSVDFSDEKIVNLLKILQSMSGDSKANSPALQSKAKDIGQGAPSDDANLNALNPTASGGAQVVRDQDAQNVAIVQKDRDDQGRRSQETYDEVFVDLSFEITKFVVKVAEVVDKQQIKAEQPLLVFTTNELRALFLMHPLDMSCQITLKNTTLTHLAYQFPGSEKPLPVFESSVDPGTGYMLKITYLQAEPKHPEFRNRFNNTLSAVKCHVGEMSFAFHQEAIVSLVAFSGRLAEQLGQAPTEALDLEATMPDRSNQMAASNASQTPVGQSHLPLVKKAITTIKKPPVIQFSVTASLAALKIALCRTERFLAHLDITGMEAAMEQTRRNMVSRVVLKSINMIDPNHGAKHPQIISITGDDVLNMKVSMFDESGEEGYVVMEKVDMAVDATLGRMHFVFLWKFYLDVMSFLDSFQAAKDRVVDATAAAAAAAKGAAELAYEKAYKMALNVTVKAPVIYVPQSSLSQSCLVMDFGILSIGNSFKPGPSIPEKTVPVLYENTKIAIDNLLMYRCTLRPLTRDPVDQSSFSIMDPVSFGLEVQRNLTAAAHKQLPELRMKGTITSVRFKVGEDDYAAVMKTLGENFAETPPGYRAPAAADALPSPATKQAVQEQVPNAGKEVVTVERHIKSEVAEEKLVRMQVFFTLQEIKLQLYTRRNLEKCEELCELNIAGFKLCGNFNHDNSFWVNMFLVNLLLDDRRISRKSGLRRLITKGDDSEKMIDIIYQAENTGAFATKVFVSKMRFVYSASLNMALLDLVNQANVNAEAQNEADQLSRERRAITNAVSAGQVAACAQPASAPPPTSTTPKNTVPFTLMLQISQPDVLLVADLENPSSACIIFKSSVSIRVKQDDTKMNTTIQLQDIEMFVSSVDSGGAQSEILKKCEIIVEMNQDITSQEANVHVTPIEIHMTPSAVEIVSASLSALSATSTDVDADKIYEYFDPRKIWMPQSLDDLSLWYACKSKDSLNFVEVAEEAQDLPAVECNTPLQQRATFAMDRILITIEQGSGAQTLPMLLVNSSLKGDACNWSSELQLDSVLNCVVFYYNERFAVWEPLLESVETLGGGRQPWEMTMSVRAASSGLLDPEVPACQLPSLYSVLIRCKDNLELTVSKTALQVLQSLGHEFSQAFHQKEDMVDSRKIDAPYCIKNELGVSFIVNVQESNFVVATSEGESAVVDNNHKLHLDFRNRSTSLSLVTDGNVEEQSKDDRLFFNVRMSFGQTDTDRKLNVNYTARRVFRVPFRSYPGDDWSYIVDVKSHYGSRLVTLYSIVEVYNGFSIPMEIFYKQGDDVVKCSCVDPKGLTHVPLVALYTYSNELLFKPVDDRYQLAEKAFNWKTDPKEETLVLCKATNPSKPPLCMMVVSSTEELIYDDSPTEKCVTYRIRLAPTVVVNNLLPVSIDVNLKENSVHFDLKAGAEIELWNAKVNQNVFNIRMEYGGTKWHSIHTIEDTIDELSPVTFKSSGDFEKSLDLAMHYEKKEGSKLLSIHCPLWMVNRTEADLFYKVTEDSICHARDNLEPVLFTFGAKHMFAPKKKMSLRLFDSEWSSKTPLDVVGQSGTIMAKSSNTDRIYPLSVSISLSSTTLTRIVTFTPFYMITNNSKFNSIEVRENVENSDWLFVEPDRCVPFWPRSVTKVELLARYHDSAECTLPFSIKESSSVLLKLDNKYGGMFMTCQVEDSASVVSISDYEMGLSAVQIVNDTEENVFLRQEFPGSSAQCVQANHSVHYAWEDPRENRQMLCWVSEHDVCKVGPLTDANGCIDLKNSRKIFWASFLDGKQRVLYFCSDAVHFAQIEKVGSLERCNMEFELEFNGMGISLVDDDPLRREVVYLSITGSGAHWESRNKAKQKYKILNAELSTQMEIEYQKFLTIAKTVGPHAVSAFKIGKYRIDFNKMEITAPEPKVLRRNKRPGLWFHMKTTDNQKAVHLKVHRIQMDNQIRDCQLPVILSPVIYKRTVGERKMVKPLIEMSVIMRQFQGSQLRQIKYCKLLIQEFAIRIDMCFVNSMLAFVTLSEKKTEYAELMDRDIKTAAIPLKEIASVHAVQGQRDYIDYLHLSPMKIHLSFSMSAGGSAPPPEGAFSGLKLLLKSFGVTLAEFQDAVLKLDYFERKHDFSTMSQLNNDVISHYTKQTLKQIYVVILGLDVIGNPVGLLMGITTGVGDLFYEPLQGAIQGPEEFVAGLAQGVASLIGHTVGGAADAMGKITGALGKGVAVLTMDEEYQKKRRMEKNKRPQDITEGIAQSGKNLVMGFYDGVTGVVTKPLEGAREEGVSGFMKGMGKGVIGVVARPASGIVDFASGTFASVKRATELEDVPLPVRPPRLIRSDGIVTAYNRMEAEGHQLLQDVENGKYALSDAYITHLSVCSDGRNFVIITSHRILFVEKGDIFGHWNCEWEYSWDQIKPPLTCSEGVKLLLKEPKKKGLFQGKENGKIINISDTQISEWLCQQIVRAMSQDD